MFSHSPSHYKYHILARELTGGFATVQLTPSTVLCTRLRKWTCILMKTEGNEHVKHS